MTNYITYLEFNLLYFTQANSEFDVRAHTLKQMSNQISVILRKSTLQSEDLQRKSRSFQRERDSFISSQERRQFFPLLKVTEPFVKKDPVELQAYQYEQEGAARSRSSTDILAKLPVPPANSAAKPLVEADAPTFGSAQSVQAISSTEAAEDPKKSTDPLDDLIEQLRIELSSLKSQVRLFLLVKGCKSSLCCTTCLILPMCTLDDRILQYIFTV